ncbi:MAG: DNA-3-methyladenine glycosylase 2 family protein [Methylibium sp.]|uniref:DNA-3-methyladenine glycosylase 2 family protein n=1 Tax=Methylibium sp. TaxID=2067992 RepID=UPI0017F8BA69|nr:AlkA N-terminal domain-containing protein [Methylibium sp.]MBA3598080.1 DNA-3-methyladenine glycosylase 2 family protein [Methylibium sp.]
MPALPFSLPEIDADAAYRAWQTHDARFDGRLFAGVTSTGVYCRPVCRVRLPRRANLRFFRSAASAQQHGFRPCLRCRPELAPGLSLVDSSQVLAQHAARMLDHAARSGAALRLPDIAARLGVTDRHLRRIFALAHGVTPIDYWTTQRLLLAKQLLTDTRLPVTEVALQCGFASVRRFNAAFAQHCRLSPTRLRRAGGTTLVPRRATVTPLLRLPGTLACDALKLRLAYRPPCDTEALMHFFAQRAVKGIEAVEQQTLRRTLRLVQGGREHIGWLALRSLPDIDELEVMIAAELVPALGRVIEAVRQAFDLDADPARIDPVMALLSAAPRPGLRLAGSFDGFETAVRVILGQQVTVKGARTLIQRLVGRFGTPLATPFADLSHLFPNAARLAAVDPADIGTLGIVRQRVGAIQALARGVAAEQIELHRGAPIEATLAALRALPGVGEWTAQVIAMRALAWPDAWPAGDIGLANALGSREPKRLTELAEAWRPWRAYAVMRLWHLMETGT